MRVVRFQGKPRETGAGGDVGDVQGSHGKLRLNADPAQSPAREPEALLLAPELDPQNPNAPEDMARFLGEGQKLPAEARASLAALIRKEHGRSLPELVAQAYPPGSEPRRRLGDALVRYAGGLASGVSPVALESLLSQSLVGFGEAPPPRRHGTKRPGPAVPAGPRASQWSDVAVAILVPRRRAAVKALARLEGKVELARVLLSTVAVRGARSRFELEQAALFLEKALLKVVLARELFGDDAVWQRLAPRALLARREVADLRPVLWQLHEVLSRPARRRAAVRPTPGEIGDIDRAAEVARETLSIVVAMGELVAELDAEPMNGPLTPGDLHVLGLAFAPEAPPPQTLWDDEMVDGLLRLRRDVATSRRAGRVSLTAKGRHVRAADLLVALRSAGSDLAHIDPGQIGAAARYIDQAHNASIRQERFLKVEAALRVLAQAERSVWSRERMGARLTALGGVPERAVLRLPEAEVLHCFQEVARAVNTSPSVVHVKVGDHRLALATDTGGHVVRSSCRKHSLVTKSVGALYRSVPLALTALRHMPVTAPLGQLLSRPVSASESLSQRALIRLTHLGSDLLGAEASLGLHDAAARADVAWSFHSAERSVEEARRRLAAGLAAFDPAAIARANKQLERADEARRGAVRQYAADVLRRGLPAGLMAQGALGVTTGGTIAPVSIAPESQRTPRPSTTGVSLRALVKELRQTRMLVERAQHTAAETSDLAGRPGVPNPIREAAVAADASVEDAMTRFRNELSEAQGPNATEAARVGLERRLIQIFADYQQLHIALAALPGTPKAPPTET
ncbi:MAG TPA: hypothetical protein VMV21_02930 [Vicinamibacteria bacterium]|nr:hypothetical protein [Vicinamibacteria bacterium]